MSASLKRVPFLDSITGKIPSKYLAGTLLSGSRTALTLGSGFIVPAWGVNPSTYQLGPDQHLAGHIGRSASNLVANAVLITGGTFTAGKVATAVTDTGIVQLTTTATTIVLTQILSGASPTWVSLDGVIL